MLHIYKKLQLIQTISKMSCYNLYHSSEAYFFLKLKYAFLDLKNPLLNIQDILIFRMKNVPILHYF